ncbi:MAG TPA: NAD(P)H-dependent oxidoreductase [Candidatus Limnocylindria bacterium]|jgi:nitroreductase|nr:NAD(P)H-dependent oxidoreductase [Candidatus Limnocylindria bacterium]
MSQVITSEQLLAQLNWRYAAKKFDPARKIPAEIWATLEQSLILAPSSFGLQPWKFVVVTDPLVKQQLAAQSWGQTQPIECSHHVVFTVRKNLGADEVDHFIERVVEVRGVAKESLTGYRNVMVKSLEKAAAAGYVDQWQTHQVYIALGQFMASAAMLGIDTCPMEGIVPAEYDRVLGLTGTPYATVVACAVGYRSPDCKYATTPKVRFPASEVIQHV